LEVFIHGFLVSDEGYYMLCHCEECRKYLPVVWQSTRQSHNLMDTEIASAAFAMTSN